tara:strand:- start:1706 stop:2464 length:759 start_codon:yes stop_codon:yes gene_type:complete
VGVEIELVLLCFGLFFVAILYSSVGHGGASGYLAILSLSSYANIIGLKQYAWCLNLVVAAISFYHYYNAGHFVKKLTFPFIIGSVPFAIIGGYIKIDENIYDSLLSITLIWAAYKLYTIKNIVLDGEMKIPKLSVSIPIGAGIGFFSGVIGVGGGIFLSPLILLKRWAEPKNVAATSALFIWINSLSGLFGAGFSNQLEINLEILLPFLICVLLGGYIGSKYGSLMEEYSIKKILIFVLIIAAIKRLLEILI